MATALAGCGASANSVSSSRTVSAHDQSALKQIDSQFRRYRALENAVAADTIAGSKIHSRDQYIQHDGPRIVELDNTAQSIRNSVGSLDDPKLAQLYDPLSEALSREANDFKLFLNTLRQGNATALQQVYTRVGQDERHVNNVALEQLPKVRAYARQFGG